ncbi:hypothetical protein [Kitasatospora purpeofusca]|nr:hypothetical protein [Kitasatospora purpeofusca]
MSITTTDCTPECRQPEIRGFLIDPDATCPHGEPRVGPADIPTANQLNED